MGLLLKSSVVVLHPGKLLHMEPNADEGEDEKGEKVVEEGPAGMRMTVARTDIGWMSASNSTLNTRSLSGVEETF